MNDSTMLYRHPGPHQIHGGSYDYVIVPDAEVDGAVAHGWFRTTNEALEASRAAQQAAEDGAAPTREEMLVKAAELGIEVDGRWGDKRLAAEIKAKL